MITLIKQNNSLNYSVFKENPLQLIGVFMWSENKKEYLFHAYKKGVWDAEDLSEILEHLKKL